MISSTNKLHISIFIALLFHVCGAIGILLSPYKLWFIYNTPLNLSIMAGLLIFTQLYKNKIYYLFLLIAVFTGMVAEIIGVNTHWLFGNYWYGDVMGPKIAGVPLLIGVNWWITVFCCGAITDVWYKWVQQKYTNAGLTFRKRFTLVAIVADGAFLATYFDYLIEPVAQKLNYWQWKNGEVPFFNYICWFVISAFLLVIFRKLPFYKHNHFALHLFIIQALFFVALRLYL